MIMSICIVDPLGTMPAECAPSSDAVMFVWERLCAILKTFKYQDLLGYANNPQV